MADTTARGYGTKHQNERAKYQARIDRGHTYTCARVANGTCRTPTVPITKDTPWDLGHTDDRTGYTGPEHVNCNRAAGARNSNRPKLTLREW